MPVPEDEGPKAYPSVLVWSNDRDRTTIRARTFTDPKPLRGVIMGTLDRREEEVCYDR